MVILLDFDTVLRYCKAYLSDYYEQMYYDMPAKIDRMGTEHWGEAAHWMKEFHSSHLNVPDPLEKYREQGYSEAEIFEYFNAADLPPKDGPWGEIRCVKPTDASEITILDFPSREFEYEFIGILSNLTDSPVVSFRYFEYEPNKNSKQTPLFSEIEVHEKRHEVRTVRVSWSDVLTPPGSRDIRRTFLSEGAIQSFEVAEYYDRRKIVERLPLDALLKMMKNLGFSGERLIYDKIFDQAVLLSGPGEGKHFEALEADIQRWKEAEATF